MVYFLDIAALQDDLENTVLDFSTKTGGEFGFVEGYEAELRES